MPGPFFHRCPCFNSVIKNFANGCVHAARTQHQSFNAHRHNSISWMAHRPDGLCRGGFPAKFIRLKVDRFQRVRRARDGGGYRHLCLCLFPVYITVLIRQRNDDEGRLLYQGWPSGHWQHLLLWWCGLECLGTVDKEMYLEEKYI